MSLIIIDFIVAVFICVVGLALLTSWTSGNFHDLFAEIGHFFLQISRRHID